MTVHEVTYFEVSCDAPSCERKTQDLGDFAAWSDRSQAVDNWVDCEGAVLKDGAAFCEDHIPVTYCRDSDDEAHHFDADGDCACGVEVANV